MHQSLLMSSSFLATTHAHRHRQHYPNTTHTFNIALIQGSSSFPTLTNTPYSTNISPLLYIIYQKYNQKKNKQQNKTKQKKIISVTLFSIMHVFVYSPILLCILSITFTINIHYTVKSLFFNTPYRF